MLWCKKLVLAKGYRRGTIGACHRAIVKNCKAHSGNVQPTERNAQGSKAMKRNEGAMCELCGFKRGLSRVAETCRNRITKAGCIIGVE